MAVTAGLMVAGCSQLPFTSAEVPDVTGFGGARAKQILDDAGFEVDRNTPADCATDAVTGQVPDGGARLEKGKTVWLSLECVEEKRSFREALLGP